MSGKIFSIGKIKAPNGLKGKMWITPFGDTFNAYPQYLIGNSDTPRKLVLLEKRKNGLVAQFEGIVDISQAEALKGQIIYVKREWLPDTPEGEYYWNDLIGMHVIDTKGRTLGEIVSIIPTGSNDVLVVDRDKQHMIPLTDGVVRKVSLKTNTMTVDITSLEEILEID
jgi:16S rRNA processing protein RimM